MLKTIVACVTIFVIIPAVVVFVNNIIDAHEKKEIAEYAGTYYGVTPDTWNTSMTLHEDGDYSNNFDLDSSGYIFKSGEFEVGDDGFDAYRIDCWDPVIWVEGDYDNIAVVDTPIHYTQVENYIYGPGAIYYEDEDEPPLFDEDGVSNKTIGPEDPSLSVIEQLAFKSDGSFTMKYNDGNEVSGTYRLDGKVLYLENITDDVSSNYVFIYDKGDLYQNVYEKQEEQPSL